MVMQMETVECGAACLTMVLAYFGKWLPLEEVRLACNVSRDGSSAKNIIHAARNYGLKAHGYSSSYEMLDGLQPAIIHWNFKHFVLFRGFKKGKAYINDPETGPVEVPMDEFVKSYTSYSENLHSYVNNINTHEGGTHLAGFRRGLTRTLKA